MAQDTPLYADFTPDELVTMGSMESGWWVHEASLEEIVLAYLAEGSGRALPGPVASELQEAHR